MTDFGFDDLLMIRRGGHAFTMGNGASWLGKIDSAEEWELKADALRDIFLQTLGAQPKLSKKTDVKVLNETDRKSHWLREIEYNVDADERIKAYVLIPKRLNIQAPAMLCIPPTKPNSKEWLIGSIQAPDSHQLAYALHLVERGYVTLVYDWLGAGSRAFKDCPEFDTAPFYRKYPEWSARGKDIWDAARSLDVLEQMDEVDSHRIGCIGHSQGGGITIDLAALDTRIKVGVSSCGGCPERLSKNPFNHARTGWWVGRPMLRPFCIAGKHFPIDMHEIIALAAPRAIMLSNAVNDYQYQLGNDSDILQEGFEQMRQSIENVYDLTGKRSEFKSLLHQQGHGFPGEQRDVAYTFINTILNASS